MIVTTKLEKQSDLNDYTKRKSRWNSIEYFFKKKSTTNTIVGRDFEKSFSDDRKVFFEKKRKGDGKKKR